MLRVGVCLGFSHLQRVSEIDSFLGCRLSLSTRSDVFGSHTSRVCVVDFFPICIAKSIQLLCTEEILPGLSLSRFATKKKRRNHVGAFRSRSCEPSRSMAKEKNDTTSSQLERLERSFSDFAVEVRSQD